MFLLFHNIADKKKLIEILIPVIIAAAVFTAVLISGRVTKNLDETKPTAQTTEKSEEPSAPSKSSGSGVVTLTAVGDNLIQEQLIAAGQSEDGTEDYSSFYANISKYLSSSDIAAINQETVLGGSDFDYSGYPLYNTPWAVGEAAADAGFNLFTCATEHALDMGYEGIRQECAFFDKLPDTVHLGTHTSESDYSSIKYIKKNNIVFALLNYTHGTNGILAPDDKQWCVDIMDKEKITRDIKEARGKADVVVVFPHWGTENSIDVTSYQKEYVQLFSDLGVDIVIGTHPHVLQQVEWIENSNTGRRMLVYYSLGNFISYQTGLDQLCGGMAQIKIEKTRRGTTVSSAKLIPTVCWYNETNGDYSFTVYALSDYTKDIAKTHFLFGSGATPEYFTKLVDKVIPKEFL